MTPQDESSLPALLGDARTTLAALDLAGGATLDAIERFVGGAPVAAVAGRPRSGRSTLIAGLEARLPRMQFVEVPAKGFPTRGLWDAVVVATPADSALSLEEALAVRDLRCLRRPVCVIVTGADLLGDNAARRDGEAEIARLRLRPNLDAAVGWGFVGRGEAPEPAATFLADVVARAAQELHVRPALDALAELLDAAIAAQEQRVEVHAREEAQVAAAEGAFPLAVAQLFESGRLTLLQVRDALRTAYDRFVADSGATADALDAWVLRGGRGDPEDALDAVRGAWRRFDEAVAGARDEAVAAYGREVGRLAGRVDDVGRALGFQAPPVGPSTREWFREGTEDAFRRLRAADLEPVLAGSVAAARENLERQKAVAQGGIGARATAWIANRTPLAERLREELLAGLEAVVRPHFQAALQHASEDAQEATQEANEAATQMLRERLAWLRGELERRHAWSRPYASLLALADRTDAARRRP